VDAVAPQRDALEPAQPVTWLSGEIVTLFNKIGPILWLAAVVGGFFGIFLSTGRVFVAPAFRFLVAFVVVATALIFWLGLRIQRVGYAGRELAVSNYLRQERIPFHQVEAVEPVWWYYRRMVRIRLRSNTSFGQVVYYIPKWAAFRCLWVAPEKELQEILAANPRLPPWG
jgi:hypothetical protein